jgi:hypothetical protein
MTFLFFTSYCHYAQNVFAQCKLSRSRILKLSIWIFGLPHLASQKQKISLAQLVRSLAKSTSKTKHA